MGDDSGTRQSSPGITRKRTKTVACRRGPLRNAVGLLVSVWVYILTMLLEYACGLMIRLLDLLTGSVPPGGPDPCRQTSLCDRRYREGRKRQSNVQRLLSRLLPAGLLRLIICSPDTASFGASRHRRRDVGTSPNKLDGKGSKRKQRELLQISESDESVDGNLSKTDASEDPNRLSVKSLPASSPVQCEQSEGIAEGTASSSDLNESQGSTLVHDVDSDAGGEGGGGGEGSGGLTESKVEGDKDVHESHTTDVASTRSVYLSVLMGDDIPDENSVDDPSYMPSTTGTTLDSDDFSDCETVSEGDELQPAGVLGCDDSSSKPNPELEDVTQH